jgi:hypothetical protein
MTDDFADLFREFIGANPQWSHEPPYAPSDRAIEALIAWVHSLAADTRMDAVRQVHASEAEAADFERREAENWAAEQDRLAAQRERARQEYVAAQQRAQAEAAERHRLEQEALRMEQEERERKMDELRDSDSSPRREGETIGMFRLRSGLNEENT